MSISTLVIGIGGTGVLALRRLKRLREEMGEESVPCLFLAFDFDRSSLSEPDKDMSDLAEDEFFFLDPKYLQATARNLDRNLDGALAWGQILEWFPDPNRVRIPVSEVEANGASQLRALGRLGFFLNDEAIESLIRQRLASLKTEVDKNRLSAEQRVILVSSLAGGTGAGMCIDFAYVARRQDSHPRVFGYFLLPEVFRDVDTGGRIYPNTYASLKELAYLKDQQIPFRANYPRIPPMDIPVGGEEPFARLYLCGGQAEPGGAGIRRAAKEMATMILGQLNAVIQEKTLSIASNTVSSEAEGERQRRQTHCFSTVTSVHVRCKPIGDAADAIFQELLKVWTQKTELQQIKGPEVRKYLRDLFEHYHLSEDSESQESGSAQAGEEREEDRRVLTLVRGWASRVKEASSAGAKQIIAELKANVELARASTKGAAELEKARPKTVNTPDAAPTPVLDDAGALEVGKKHLDTACALIYADYTKPEYHETNLEALKGLASFDEANNKLKEDIRFVVQMLKQTVASDPGDSIDRAQRLEAFLSRLQEHQDPFWVKFAEAASPEIQKIKKESESEHQAHQGFLKRSWNWRADDTLTEIHDVLRRCDLAVQALQKPWLEEQIANILRARMANFLKKEIENALNDAERALAPHRAIWADKDLAFLATQARTEITAPVRKEAVSFAQKYLSAIAQQARKEINDSETPMQKHEKVLSLIRQFLQKDNSLEGYRVQLEEDQEGTEARLRAELVRSKQTVFERRTPNLQRRGFTLVMFPEGLFWEKKGDGSQLQSFLVTNATQILGCGTQVREHKGNDIWIYHEDLFNPPAHIRNIDEYYRQYAKQSYKEVFHIDRRFLDVEIFKREIVAFLTFMLSCGNPNCGYNIANEPRTAIVCPGCWNPIRSRCGNDNCMLDTLHQHERRKDKSCPECHGYNHASWWCCTKHGDLPVDIPIDKERCPECIQAHQRNPVAFPESSISERPDMRTKLFCKSCDDIATKNPKHKRFRIPLQLQPYYRNGVNGHDLEDFIRVADANNLPGRVRCPQCRSYLIPVHHHQESPDCTRKVP